MDSAAVAACSAASTPLLAASGSDTEAEKTLEDLMPLHGWLGTAPW